MAFRVILLAKNISYKYIYKFLSLMIDLSEYVYYKLKYIKSNYKAILLSIFEEEDVRTLQISAVNGSKRNKYVEAVLLWLVSLFGALEDYSVELIKEKSHAFFIFFKAQIYAFLSKRKSKRPFVTSLSFFFVVFFYFT